MPEFPDVVALAVPGFILFMVLEVFWAKWSSRGRYETRDTLASLTMGAGNLVEGVVLGFVGYGVLAFFHQFAPFDWGWGVGAIALCFVIDDLRYYWFHRVSHEVRWFWASHVNHHSSQHYNLSTALRQTWTGTLCFSVIFRIPLALLGFHPLMIAFVGGLNLVYQFWIHTELIEKFPRPIEAVFNTPSHHRVHHATNPRYLDANYAGTLIVWDRVFGTFVPERLDDPPRYGLVENLDTFNPVRIAFHEWVGLAQDVLRPGLTVGERLMYLFGPPGWSHDGSRRTTASLKAAFLEDHPDQAGEPGLPEVARPAPRSSAESRSGGQAG